MLGCKRKPYTAVPRECQEQTTHHGGLFLHVQLCDLQHKLHSSLRPTHSSDAKSSCSCCRLLAGTSSTPVDSTAASASSNEAMTPLCFDLNSLQLSAASAQPERPAMPSHDRTADAPDLLRPESTEESTPALTAEQRGWDRSLLDTPGL